ncbi:MAG: LPS-assembly protein LptD [Hyphomicrobiales bacterium]
MANLNCPSLSQLLQKHKQRTPLLAMRGLRVAVSTVGILAGLSATTAFSQNASPEPINLKVDQEDKLILDADTLVFDSNQNIITVKGDVQIFFKDNTLEADRVVYDRNKNTINAMGNVRIKEATGNTIRSEKIKLSDDFKTAFVQSLQIDSIDNTFFAARSAERTDGNRTVLKKGVYNVCAVCRIKPGRIPTWRLKAEEVIIDEETHKISYEDATFEFLGVPIAYLPKFSHADPRIKQKSGLLGPQFVIDSQLGVGAGIPYYHALSESRDLTITPTYLSRQGLLGDIEWRQRLANGAYSLHLAGIRQNSPEEFIGESGDARFRGGLRTTGKFSINKNWDTGWDILALTDRTFTDDYNRLTNRVDRFTSNGFLTGLSRNKFFDARGLFFNILDDDTDTSGNLQRQQAIVLPSIDYDGIIEQSIAGGQLSYRANLTSLTRENEDLNFVNGTGFLDGASGTQGRISTELEWKRQFIAPGGHVITPSFAIRGDAQAHDQLENNFAGLEQSDQQVRGQVTGGLEWRYPVLITSGKTSHIIEPIAQIFVSPSESKADQFLNEDSQNIILDDTNIFQRDRFSGFDRVEGGTRANVGFTHQGQWSNSLTTDFLVGQSFHLAGDNSFTEQGVASIYSINGLETDRSDIITRIGITAIDQYGLVARGQFDEDLKSVARGDFNAFYNGNIFTASAGYTFISDEIVDDLERSSQINGAATFKFHNYWTLFGDARYDLDDSRFVDNRIGLTFDDDQLRVSLAFFQDFDDEGVRDGEGIEFRVNLRTLGGL